MVWSALIGLGTSLLGAHQAGKKAKREERMYSSSLRNQQAEQERMYRLAREAGAKTDARNDQLLDWEQWARMTAASERDYQIQEGNRYADQLLEERQFEIDRQVKADQEAARIQAFRLQEMLRNQNIAADERKFAEQQLAEVQRIASEEATRDLKHYYENQHRAQIHRDYMMGLVSDGRQIARQEQDREIAHRDRITGMIDGLRGRVQAVHDSFGSAPEIERMTRADIDNEINRRTQQYTADVDRAADRVASISEAGLIRDGIDRSTTGTVVRGEVASRLADEYQTARNRAYDDALAYITGQYGALSQNAQDIMDNRGSRLAEVAGVGGAGIGEMISLPGITSQLAALQLGQLVGDGIYHHDLKSANDYRAPVDMGSAIYESDLYTMTPGMSNFNVGTSAAVNRAAGVGTAITDPATLILEAPSTYYGNAMNAGQYASTARGNMYAGAQTRAINAGATFGDNLTGFLNDNQDAINKKLNSWFGFGGSGSGTSFAPTTSIFPQSRPTTGGFSSTSSMPSSSGYTIPFAGPR